jgi:hypothetical protein
MRGTFDFNASGYTPQQMAEGRVDAMLVFIYLQLRDCARRAALKFDYTLDEFIDLADEDILDVFGRLNKKEDKPGEALRETPPSSSTDSSE